MAADTMPVVVKTHPQRGDGPGGAGARAPCGRPRCIRFVACTHQGLRGGPGRRQLSPFVGRHQEVTTLQTVLAQADGGRGQVVGVVGEPGLGKSRLFSEFRQRLQDRPLTYLAASCLSHTQATPYGPVRALLQRQCGITAAVRCRRSRHRLRPS